MESFPKVHRCDVIFLTPLALQLELFTLVPSLKPIAYVANYWHVNSVTGSVCFLLHIGVISGSLPLHTAAP